MTASPAFRPLQPALEATPGPWRALPPSQDAMLEVIACPPGGGEGVLVAGVYACDEAAANAALIASAHRLYAALARVVELTGAGVFEWSAAEACEACAALAAARGEGGTS